MEGNNNEIYSIIVISNDNLTRIVKISKLTKIENFYQQIIDQFPQNDNLVLKLFYFEGYSHRIYYIEKEEDYITANKKGIEYFYLCSDNSNNQISDEGKENLYYMKYHSVILFSPMKNLNSQYQNSQRKKMQIENTDMMPKKQNQINYGNQNMINNNNNFMQNDYMGYNMYNNQFNNNNFMNNNNIMNYNIENNNLMNNNMMMNNMSNNNIIMNNNNFIFNNALNNPMGFINILNQLNYNDIDYIIANNIIKTLYLILQSSNQMMLYQMMSCINPMILKKCFQVMQQNVNNMKKLINNNNINNNIIQKTIPEYETIDTEINPLNKYIENAINISYTMKLDILNNQNNNSNKFINISQILSSPGFLSGNHSINDDYQYILSLIGKMLQNHGIIVGIYKKNQMKDRIDLSAIQFIFSGLINKKKYQLKFSVNRLDMQNIIYDLSYRKSFINKWKGIIANKLNVNKKLIILTNPRDEGKLCLDLAFNPIVGIFQENYIKSTLIQGEIIGCTMLPLIEACRLSPSIFDKKYHKIYKFAKNNLRRGGEDYLQPLGWSAYGINMAGKYDFGNNTWLGNKNKIGEFAVAYYGINNLLNQNFSTVQNIISLMGNQETGKTFINSKNLRNPGQVCNEGAYFYKNPKIAENSSDKILIGVFQYKIMFMCRVKPSQIRQPEAFKECWILSPTPDEVRPYKILVKQIPLSPLAFASQIGITMCFDKSPSPSYLQILKTKDESYFFNFNNNNFFNSNNFDSILRDYTGGGFHINDYLRNNNLNNNLMNSYIWCLHKAITQNIPNVPNGTVVYRGIGVKLPYTLEIGQNFYFREFLSTSKDYNIAKGFSNNGTLIVITILNNGINGKMNYCRDIEPISAFPFEKEILFTSHCQFRVTNIENNVLYLACEGYNFNLI